MLLVVLLVLLLMMLRRGVPRSIAAVLSTPLVSARCAISARTVTVILPPIPVTVPVGNPLALGGPMVPPHGHGRRSHARTVRRGRRVVLEF